MILPAEGRDALRAVLEQARLEGFLGPGPVDPHIDHAAAFGDGLDAPARALDLGSGGGVPSLALACLAWPACQWVLLDARKRSYEFLEEAVVALGLTSRVEVVRGRAEEAGRLPALRASFDLVTARGFAPPGITAECGAPFLKSGGHLVVSEPPGGAPDRWDAAGLAALGLVRDEAVAPHPGAAMARFRQAELCPDRYPRRTGIPAKRPLF